MHGVAPVLCPHIHSGRLSSRHMLRVQCCEASPGSPDEDADVRTSFLPRLVLIGSLVLAAGCATTRQVPMSCGSLSPNADVVYVADGSGDYRTTSAALGQAVRDTGAPLRIETIAWSHGYSRLLADNLDHAN